MNRFDNISIRPGMVVGIGELLWDVLPEGKKIGGAPANFAFHISQFGLPGCAISAVGNDSSGKELIDMVNTLGIKASLAITGFPTGTVDVTLDCNGIPEYDIRENVAWDNIPFSENLSELAASTSAVIFGSLAQRGPVSRSTIARFIDSIPDGPDTLKIFDINLRQDFYSREIIDSSLERCNILKINDEELAVIDRIYELSGNDFPGKCRTLIDRHSLKMLILTCGTDGSYVFSDEEVSFLPTPKVDVADTVGAGDSFTAAFTASVLNGKTIAEAHRTAVEVAAFVCSRNGAMPELPADIIRYRR